MKSKKLHVVELYAGTARSSEPFRRWPKCKIALLVDNDQYAADTYLKNRRNAPYVVKDLRKVSADWIRRKSGGRVDILLGCPPCQGFSDNGRRNPRDHRNRHLRQFAQFAVELQPRAIGMENVPLAVSARAFQHFSRMIEEAGYCWTAGIVNAALYGSSQCRQRLVFIAIRNDLGCKPLIPSPTHGGRRKYFNYTTGALKTIRQARNSLLGVAPATFQVRGLLPYSDQQIGETPIPCVVETLADLPSVGTAKARRLRHIPWAHSTRQRRRMGQVPEGGQLRCAADYYSQSYGRLHRRGLARTITGAFPNAGSGRFWHPSENRSLTLREAARLQGFPDSFRFIEPLSRGAFLVGNALDRALADVTYRVVKTCLSRESSSEIR